MDMDLKACESQLCEGSQHGLKTRLTGKCLNAVTVLVVLALPIFCRAGAPEGAVLNFDDLRHYVDHFNSMEDENVATLISNAQAWEWMKRNVPAFECPDKAFEEIYWYRWW